MNRDNTLNAPSGHYMYFMDTDRRPLKQARMLTGYMNTTGTCIRLFYRFIGNIVGQKSSTLIVSEFLQLHVERRWIMTNNHSSCSKSASVWIEHLQPKIFVFFVLNSKGSVLFQIYWIHIGLRKLYRNNGNWHIHALQLIKFSILTGAHSKSTTERKIIRNKYVKYRC